MYQRGFVGGSGLDHTGERIGHYRIVARSGRGGMGDVYEAEDETLRRRVALKAIRARPCHHFFTFAPINFRPTNSPNTRSATLVHRGTIRCRNLTESLGRLCIIRAHSNGRYL